MTVKRQGGSSMRMCTCFGALQLRRWLTRDDAERFLQANDARVLEVPLVTHGKSWSTLLRESTPRHPAMGLLIEAEHHGIDPQLLLTPGRIVLGVGGHVCSILPAAWKVAWTYVPAGPFYGFVCASAGGEIVIAHELGVDKLDENGRPIWSYPSMEIVSGWDIDTDTLEVRLYDGSRTALDLTTGRVVEVSRE